MNTKINLEIPKAKVEKKKYIGLIHKIYHLQLKKNKQYTASTKTKSEVRGGGRKPWKQKGTGNARSGSIRSSIWVGGGVSFGPKYHVVKKKINKKEKLKANLTCFFLKSKRIKIFSNNENEMFSNITKTNEFIKILQQFNFKATDKILIILSKFSKNLFLAIRNIKQIKLVVCSKFNLKQILICDYILISEENYLFLKNLYEKYSK
jgi:large subunit ribosomal protein L4